MCHRYTSESEALKLIHGREAVLNDFIDHMIRARKLLTELAIIQKNKLQLLQISKIYDSAGPLTWYKKPYFGGVGPWTKSFHFNFLSLPSLTKTFCMTVYVLFWPSLHLQSQSKCQYWDLFTFKYLSKSSMDHPVKFPC